MRKLCGLTLAVMLALVAMAPRTASAVPVPPPPDIASPEECVETEDGSLVCPASMTVDIVVGGVVVYSETCPLEYEEIAQFTGLYVSEHFFVFVQAGYLICLYGACGGFVMSGGIIIVGTL